MAAFEHRWLRALLKGSLPVVGLETMTSWSVTLIFLLQQIPKQNHNLIKKSQKQGFRQIAKVRIYTDRGILLLENICHLVLGKNHPFLPVFQNSDEFSQPVREICSSL